MGSPSKDSPDVFSFGRTEWHFHLFSMRQTATSNRKLVYRYRPWTVVNQQKGDTLRPEKIIVMRSVGRAP